MCASMVVSFSTTDILLFLIIIIIIIIIVPKKNIEYPPCMKVKLLYINKLIQHITVKLYHKNSHI